MVSFTDSCHASNSSRSSLFAPASSSCASANMLPQLTCSGPGVSNKASGSLAALSRATATATPSSPLARTPSLVEGSSAAQPAGTGHGCCRFTDRTMPVPMSRSARTASARTSASRIPSSSSSSVEDESHVSTPPDTDMYGCSPRAAYAYPSLLPTEKERGRDRGRRMARTASTARDSTRYRQATSSPCRQPDLVSSVAPIKVTSISSTTRNRSRPTHDSEEDQDLALNTLPIAIRSTVDSSWGQQPVPPSPFAYSGSPDEEEDLFEMEIDEDTEARTLPPTPSPTRSSRTSASGFTSPIPLYRSLPVKLPRTSKREPSVPSVPCVMPRPFPPVPPSHRATTASTYLF